MSPGSERKLLPSRSGSLGDSVVGIELDSMADKANDSPGSGSHHNAQIEDDKFEGLFVSTTILFYLIFGRWAN